MLIKSKKIMWRNQRWSTSKID